MNPERTEASGGGVSIFEEVARAHAAAERAEQGLGPTLSDPAVIERLATLLSSGAGANDLPKPTGDGAASPMTSDPQ